MAAFSGRLALRPLSPKDESLVFSWRNEPFIVKRSSSQRQVSWAEHRRWFKTMLSSNRHLVLIATIGGAPVGQVRFDRARGGACVISVYLIESCTGRRIGVRAIAMGCEMIRGQWPVREIRAYVRGENTAGQSAFLRAGFLRHATGTPPDHLGYRLHVTPSVQRKPGHEPSGLE